MITVYQGLTCEDIMFEVQVDSLKRINLFYDDFERHYLVIVDITGAMVTKFKCKACNKACRTNAKHRCDQTCSDCMTRPPWDITAVRILYAECNRYFRSWSYFANHKHRIWIRNPFVSARDLSRTVEHSWEAWRTTLAKVIARRINKTDR